MTMQQSRPSTNESVDRPAAGRSCPLHYRYAPEIFAVPALVRTEVLYVVGGLYGNAPALEAVLALYARERGPKRLVFNGDFNWFNIDAEHFRHINERVLGFDALRGNVETELADDPVDDVAGCGCAYPDWVGDDVVQRSNRILQRLRQTARGFARLREQLAALPMWQRVDVGEVRIAVVHGDAESLAGWGFARENLRDAQHQARVHGWFQRSQVDVFACSHTCAPVFHALPSGSAGLDRMVLNNGAAGMPNLHGAKEGLLTRIATRPFAGPERRFGTRRGGVFMDAIAIAYDTDRWERQFLGQWPAGSDAHTSYWPRIAGCEHALPAGCVVAPAVPPAA